MGKKLTMTNTLLSEKYILDLLSVHDHQNEDVGAGSDLDERRSSLSSDGDELLEGGRVGVVSEAGDSSLDDGLGHSETLEERERAKGVELKKVRKGWRGSSNEKGFHSP